MSKKHTNTCYDCIHYNICYKIEHYGRDLETNISCKEFIGVSDRVEVVRCKDCKYKFVEYDDTFTCNIFSNCYGLPYRINLDDFCSRGERRE